MTGLTKRCFALLLALGMAAAQAQAAERGVYTLIDGEARVLRGVTWLRLVPGARIEEGDIVDARSYVQLELAGGAALALQGPALAYVAALSGERARPPAEIVLSGGWTKFAGNAKTVPVRLRLPAAIVEVGDGIVVVHGGSAATEVFVESGSARVGIPVARGKEPAPREAKEGELWTRSGERAFVADERPSPAFVAAMPRDFRERLPSLAGRFAAPPPPLAAGRDVTFDEAWPWLSGPWRKPFVKRFAPRLADPEFRASAATHPIPEWDRTLHPEKYRTSE